jgi:hypothetical protein
MTRQSKSTSRLVLLLISKKGYASSASVASGGSRTSETPFGATSRAKGATKANDRNERKCDTARA